MWCASHEVYKGKGERRRDNEFKEIKEFKEGAIDIYP